MESKAARGKIQAKGVVWGRGGGGGSEVGGLSFTGYGGLVHMRCSTATTSKIL